MANIEIREGLTSSQTLSRRSTVVFPKSPGFQKTEDSRIGLPHDHHLTLI